MTFVLARGGPSQYGPQKHNVRVQSPYTGKVDSQQENTLLFLGMRARPIQCKMKCFCTKQHLDCKTVRLNCSLMARSGCRVSTPWSHFSISKNRFSQIEIRFSRAKLGNLSPTWSKIDFPKLLNGAKVLAPCTLTTPWVGILNATFGEKIFCKKIFFQKDCLQKDFLRKDLFSWYKNALSCIAWHQLCTSWRRTSISVISFSISTPNSRLSSCFISHSCL